MTDKLKAIWLRIPDWGQKFAIDAIEGAVVAIGVLNLALPRTTTEATAQVLIILAAISSPVISAARRNLLPGAVRWVVATFPRPA